MPWLVSSSTDLLNMMTVRMPNILLASRTYRGTGTPGTTSQYAKDVVTFLNWAAEPEHDERKKIGLQAVILMSTLTLLSLYTKRFKWGPMKARKIGS